LVLLRTDTAPAIYKNPGGYHTLAITLANSFDLDICKFSKIHFLGPFRHDNTILVNEFDQMVSRDLSTPKVEVRHDPQGLVARACLAGGYLHLFFSVDKIVDLSEHPLNVGTLTFGLSHFILARISTIVNEIMSLAHVRPISRNARLCLAALHVVVNRIKKFTIRLVYLRPFYVSNRSPPSLSFPEKD